ncbi:hypothetical protein Tsp_01691 [Trichinella spiralis]|uniref:hypothetical protein n=1 Tax=Trichinella spiralis TaxID=6334 RepID=UPI0001EFC889|nr:hypothetical protein Tsp_01691 [Trichinella spiralis]
MTLVSKRRRCFFKTMQHFTVLFDWAFVRRGFLFHISNVIRCLTPALMMKLDIIYDFNQRNPLSLEAEGFSLPPFYPLRCHVDVERQLHEAFQSSLPIALLNLPDLVDPTKA